MATTAFFNEMGATRVGKWTIEQSRRHGKDDKMISPQIILNHPVDFITKDDIPGNEVKLRKSLPNGRRQGPKGGGEKRRPLREFVVFHLVRKSLVLLDFLVNHP